MKRSVVLSIPSATIGFRAGRLPQAIMTLERVEGDKLYWISSDHHTLVTQHGRIVRTSGFATNLTGGAFDKSALFGLPYELPLDGKKYHLTMDFGEKLGLGFTATCQLSSKGDKEITLLDNMVSTQMFDEECYVGAIGWRFTNRYWLDKKTGFIRRSKQWTTPSQAKPFEIETLRPAIEDADWRTHLAITKALEK